MGLGAAKAVLDIRRAITLLADRELFFVIGLLCGTDQVVGLIRMNGHPMGVIASTHDTSNGGALTADGCDKVKRLIDLCDVFYGTSDSSLNPKTQWNSAPKYKRA